MTNLSAAERGFINRFQGGFPLTDRPYADAGDRIDLNEADVIAMIRRLLADGCLSRFGPLFDASRLGGGQTLAAIQVPEGQFDAVAAEVNAFPEVAHNYRREHELNMWFVVAATPAERIAETLAEIEHRTGLRVLDLPKLHEFYVGLWLRLGADGEVDTIPVPTVAQAPQQGPVHAIDELDRRIIAATQAGLPLTPDPATDIGKRVDTSRADVLERMAGMLDSGVIRRIGAVPNHYRLGLRGNGMTVWDVPDDCAVEMGTLIGRLPFVSHAYLRPRHDGIWPYNLFAMVHGRQPDEVSAKTEHIASLLGTRYRSSDVLFSSKVLKKTGLRLAA